MAEALQLDSPMGIDQGIFWVSVLVIGYTYVGYPLLLSVWARLAPRAVGKVPIRAMRTSPPAISIVLAARNEAARLPGRMINLLELNYPGSREIIVVSDGSTDGTAEAVRAFFPRRNAEATGVDPSAEPTRLAVTSVLATPAEAMGTAADATELALRRRSVDGVHLIEVPAGGKPAALNAGVAAARGDIVVFADARQRFSPDTLLELAANFADDRVGGVTGELRLDCEAPAGADSSIAEGVGLYWKYEKWLRRKESTVWSTLGATGAIYALRRRLWIPLPADTLLDDVLAPMRAVLAGHRIVFEENAVAFDRTSPDAAAESRRKTRTLAGNYQILGQEPRLLVPFVNPVWLQYVSHKIGRLIVPWALIGLFASSALLAPSSWIYASAFVAQVAFYALAVLGGWLDSRHQPGPAPVVERRPQPGQPAPSTYEPIGKGAR